ncbi:cbb3-type cytochrome c oxidase subunit 3 [Elizabethkingia sp. JS20170427COW]|uniref:cbb3-type cytochrome oxidase subunit 3 n=1 Tax=Elizabethkingia sp. JS20170427COW TaxID=2583851 RepID=UPI0011104EB1|nr:cbb3-type cytochrome c oxidase subunit 3 [Elizabethkingia sp. JS20170427COW]QCX53235.1 CcoQ/FixQ family Cbb3-type cytochrome c oxidase assembly chaperone [Elizabethkingia sp. JS20170427COW]
MVPQNFKDIIGSGENNPLYQIIALILFMIFFIGLVIVIFRKPKKYYDEEANAPLEDKEEQDSWTH